MYVTCNNEKMENACFTDHCLVSPIKSLSRDAELAIRSSTCHCEHDTHMHTKLISTLYLIKFNLIKTPSNFMINRALRYKGMFYVTAARETADLISNRN